MDDHNPYATPQSDVINTIEATSAPLASRLSRLGAAILDGIIIMMVNFPLMMVLGFWEKMSTGQIGFFDLVLSAVIGLGIWYAINYVPLAKGGQTWGKKAVGVRIVDAHTREIVPPLDILLKRTAPISGVSFIPVLGNILPLIDVLMIFRDDRRCAHDLLAGTVVVEA